VKTDAKPAPLTALERESIEYFISFVQLLGMPKSVGEIYGLLFVAREPLPMDGVVERLQISKGSASQGLTVLRDLGAVNRVYVEGDRRDYYAPDFDLVRIVNVFFRQKLQPRLENGVQRLHRMENFAAGECEVAPTGGARSSARDAVLARVRALQTWQRRGQKVLPQLLKLLSK